LEASVVLVVVFLEYNQLYLHHSLHLLHLHSAPLCAWHHHGTSAFGDMNPCHPHDDLTDFLFLLGVSNDFVVDFDSLSLLMNIFYCVSSSDSFLHHLYISAIPPTFFTY